ncbi:hypothetical protein GC194_00490 [bacterium]|nr:hypothetical protein [bacterium]
MKIGIQNFLAFIILNFGMLMIPFIVLQLHANDVQLHEFSIALSFYLVALAFTSSTVIGFISLLVLSIFTLFDYAFIDRTIPVTKLDYHVALYIVAFIATILISYEKYVRQGQPIIEIRQLS